MSEVRIAQLYPAELGITGDRGNVRALQERALRRGVAAPVSFIGIGEALPEADVIVLGNGPLSALRLVHADLLARRSQLEEHVAAGRVLLSIGGSAELLGSGLDLLDGERVEGLAVLPYRVARTRERKVGYIIVETSDARLLGFEDHASEWTLEDPDAAYGTVLDGRGSYDRGEGRGELVRRGNALAGNVQGPLLPLNPALTDSLLASATALRGFALPEQALGALDEYAESARSTIERLLHGRDFNTIGL